MRFSRVLVIGATGQLGSAILEAFRGAQTVGLGHAEIEIEDPKSVAAALDEHRPDLVISTAAFHNVPRCEREPVRALEVNAIAVDGLARACETREAAFATFSSDYVFDGEKGAPYDETDAPHPLSAYGLSKLAGELLTRAASPRHFIFRTSGLFGSRPSSVKGYTFIDRILDQARRGEQVRVVTDMTFSPSYAPHVAATVAAVTGRAPFGTYHVTNAGACTWYEFAEEALRQAKLVHPIEPTTSAEWNDGVRRPRYSALAHGALVRAGLPDVPPWQEGIAAYLRAAVSS
ncbi:MAG: dTDP-4-dehydrorhamnose reductase [Candidatus Eremiobacteraeota bacterium]|nr:dTDP-4-dehydrorhamnose reductase [Candidatus Eremiobacteraeota bacterium]